MRSFACATGAGHANRRLPSIRRPLAPARRRARDPGPHDPHTRLLGKPLPRFPSALAHGYALEVCRKSRRAGHLAARRRDPARIVHSACGAGWRRARESLRFGAGTSRPSRWGSWPQDAEVKVAGASACLHAPACLNGGSQFGMSREDLVHAVGPPRRVAGCELRASITLWAPSAPSSSGSSGAVMLAELHRTSCAPRPRILARAAPEYGPCLRCCSSRADFRTSLAPHHCARLAAMADRVSCRLRWPLRQPSAATNLGARGGREGQRGHELRLHRWRHEPRDLLWPDDDGHEGAAHW